MKNLTLRQMRYFEALAKHGHFGRAADACGISQPALSMQIKELEEDVGAALFERGARQVRLSALGEAFAGRVTGILRAVDELSDLTRAAQGSFAGRLRIGVIPTIAPYLLPGLARNLSEAYPDLELHVRETLTERLITGLTGGQIDTAIVALPVSEPALEEIALFDERFVLVRPETEAGQPVPDPESLKSRTLLLLEEGHCFRDQALSFCSLRPALPRDGLDGSSLSTLVQLVGAGMGVTLIPEMAVDVETRSAPVITDRFAGPEPGRTIGMIWRKTSPLKKQLSDIAEIVRRSAPPPPGR